MSSTNVTPLREGQHLYGENGADYLVVSPLGNPRPGVAPNVWAAVDAETQSHVSIIKQPGAEDDYFRTSYPSFQSEMVMHELFKDCPYIRRQTDRIPPRRGSTDPPRVVLEPTECTLWDARVMRPLTDGEIRTIMRGILLGLRAIHAQGLVYADLKMQNVFVNGFRQTSEKTTSEHSLIAMIGDLGIVMEPAHGKVQPLAYRAPEVHFQSLITPAADIWGWGMIYCHLLQAQINRHEPGMYEFTNVHSLQEAEQAIQQAICDDFDLINDEYYKNNSQSRYTLPRGHQQRNDAIWTERLLQSGVSKDYVDFLTWVLNPNPLERPSAQAILNHPMIGGEGSENTTGELPPNYPRAPPKQQAAFQQPEWLHTAKSSHMPGIPEVGDTYVPPLHYESGASSAVVTPLNKGFTSQATSDSPMPDAVSPGHAEASKDTKPFDWRQGLYSTPSAQVTTPQVATRPTVSRTNDPPMPDATSVRHVEPPKELKPFDWRQGPTSTQEGRGLKRGVSETAVQASRSGMPPAPSMMHQSEQPSQQQQRPSMPKMWSESGKVSGTGGLMNPGILGILGLKKDSS